MKIKNNLFGVILGVVALWVPGFVWAEVMSSSSYQMISDSINSFGSESSSENFLLNDTGGEVASGDSVSDDYDLRAGFQSVVASYKISIGCDAEVNMGSIVGTGFSELSSNASVCNIRTDNPAGYSLSWKASAEEMENSYGDIIASYTPTVSNIPEFWSMEASSSEWGGHLGSASDTVNTTTWGATDSYLGGKWLNIGTNDFEIVARPDETDADGDDEIIYFGAEVGSSKWQPTGTYTVNVTMTATTL